MAQAAKKAEEEPPRPRPERKLNSSVVPIADAVRRASKPEPTPTEPAKVTAIHRLPVKTRFDFTDEVTYRIYEQVRRIQAEEEAQAIEYLREVRDTVEVQPDPELPAPAAGAVPVSLDESERLAAYLAHWNPMGATAKIRTVEGHIVLADGTVLNVNKRQDLVEPDDWFVPPYGGFETDGMCFKLSGDLKADRKHGEHLSRRSQNNRERKGKTGKTAYENLVKIQVYRPVPDVDWFLRNPDGKSYLRGDLNPYPPGILPVGDELSAHIELKKAHARRVAEFQNFNEWARLTSSNMMKNVTSPDEVRDWVRACMMAHDSQDLLVMQGRMRMDDVPWSYDEDVREPNEAANDPDIDQVSMPQRSDASEGLPEIDHVYPRQRGALPKYINKDGFDWKWPRTEGAEPERDAEEPAAVESVVFVRSDELAMKADVRPEDRTQFASILSTAQPQAGITIAEGEQGRRMTLDLRDRRAAPYLRLQLRRLESDIDDILEHITVLRGALEQAESYRSTGEFKPPPEVRSFQDQIDEYDIHLEVERIPSVRQMHAEDIGLRSPRIKHQVEVMNTQNMRARTAGFRVMSLRADELKRSHAGVLRAWLRREARVASEKLEAQEHHAKMLRREVGRLRLIRNRAKAKLQLNQQICAAGLAEQKKHALARAEAEAQLAERLAQERERALERMEQDIKFFRALGTHNQFFRGPITRAYRRGEFVRKVKGKAKHFLNLGPKKERRVKPTPPSTVSESPVNVTAPVVTLLPARTPPALPPQQERASLLITPEVKLITFENDPVMQSLRRAHMSRLAKSGQFSPEELKQADERAFHTLVA